MSDVIKGVNVVNEKVLIGPPRKKNEEQQEDPRELARRSAEKTIKEAKLKAQGIIAQAQKKAMELEKKAREDGYKSGLQQALSEVERQVDEIKKFVEALKEREDDFFDQLKDAVIDLVIVTIKEIVLLESERGDIEKKVERALEAVKASKKITIKISKEAPLQLIESLSSIDKIQVLPISSFSKMDVQVEADFGTLDLRVDSQLELFERLVRKAVGRD